MKKKTFVFFIEGIILKCSKCGKNEFYTDEEETWYECIHCRHRTRVNRNIIWYGD